MCFHFQRFIQDPIYIYIYIYIYCTIENHLIANEIFILDPVRNVFQLLPSSGVFSFISIMHSCTYTYIYIFTPICLSSYQKIVISGRKKGKTRKNKTKDSSITGADPAGKPMQ